MHYASYNGMIWEKVNKNFDFSTDETFVQNI